MTIAETDILEALSTVVASLIEVPLRPPSPEAEESGDSLTGVITISGECEAVVLLRCDTRLARDLAAAMFAMDQDELDDAEIIDALGEVTNMTGGGIKAVLPGSCRLGLPSVTVGFEHSVGVPGTTVLGRTVQSHDDRIVSVTVMGFA
jgi:chemotaxis protein CheX